MLRFINLVENSSLEKNVIMSYVNHLRIKYLIKYTDLTCEMGFIPMKHILINFENLSQLVGVQSPQDISKNLSRSNLNVCGEMFITLNSCPSLDVKLYWEVIYGSESRMAKLASNIIRKAKDDFKVKAQQIFAKITSVLGFQHISYHNEGNKSIGNNIGSSKNMLDIKGKHLRLQNMGLTIFK